MIKKFFLYRHDGMLLSTAYLTDDEAAHQINITDIEPTPEPGKVPWFIDGAWENRDPEVITTTDIELRQRMYPPIGEQLDMLYHAMKNGEIPVATQFFETIKAVKEATPIAKVEVVHEVPPMPEG